MTPSRPALLLAAAVVSVTPVRGQDGITIATVRPGVHLITGSANGNVLVLEGLTRLFLSDAQSATRAAEADSAMRTVTGKPVQQVVFTHYHEDHTGGMAHWRQQGATAVAQRNVPAQMAKDTVIAEWNDWHRKAAAPAAMPDILFADELTLDLDGRRVRLLHLPRAHTDGDAVAWIPSANLLHTGDLVEPGAAPFIDWWAGGTLDGMIAAAERIIALVNDSTLIVPGHGRPIDRATVRRHRNMLVAVRDTVADALARRLPRHAFLAERPLAAFEDFLGGASRADAFLRLVLYGLARGGARE